MKEFQKETFTFLLSRVGGWDLCYMLFSREAWVERRFLWRLPNFSSPDLAFVTLSDSQPSCKSHRTITYGVFGNFLYIMLRPSSFQQFASTYFFLGIFRWPVTFSIVQRPTFWNHFVTTNLSKFHDQINHFEDNKFWMLSFWRRTNSNLSTLSNTQTHVMLLS